MADNPPYMNASGKISDILDRIKRAKAPDRFTNDFLSTKLGIKSSSARAFIGLAKRLGLLDQGGVPSPLYKSFRSPNKTTSGNAIASAIKKGYLDLYARNEYAHSLTREDLKALVVEATGLEPDNQIIGAIVGTFDALKKYATFDAVDSNDSPTDGTPSGEGASERDESDFYEFDLGLSYTINLVLPKTDDIAVFNSIFKSLRDNLLRK